MIADLFGTADAFERNVEIEYQRNGERYQFSGLGPGRIRRLQGGAAGHRNRAPGRH